MHSISQELFLQMRYQNSVCSKSSSGRSLHVEYKSGKRYTAARDESRGTNLPLKMPKTRQFVGESAKLREGNLWV